MSAVTAIRNPKVTLNLVSRDQTVGLEQHRVLLIGQKLSAGSAGTGLYVDLPRTGAEIDELFGARSHLAMICRKFREINQYTPVDVIALDDAGGATKATSKIVALGTATAAKTIYVDVVSSSKHSYEVDVEVGDTPATFNAKLEALIDLDARAPFTVALSQTTGTDDTITFTAENGGTVANKWLIRVRDEYNRPASVPGLTLTLTGWASGATDPSLTSILDPVANIRYQGIVWPQAYATSVIKAFINARFNLDNDIKDGVVFQWVEDTFSNVKTLASNMNSASFVMMTNETQNSATWKGPHVPEAPDVLAVTLCAARARRFEEGISISDLVVINESRDQFGGRHTASLPYFNTPFLNVEVPERGSGYTYPEQVELETAGLTVIGSNVAQNAVIASVVLTTYKNDAAGNPDDTWHFLEWRDTHSTIREFFVNNLREDFSQHRLTMGSTVAGLAIANEASIRSQLYTYYDILADDAITVAGREAHKIFEDRLRVTIKPELRRVELDCDVPMVSQLGVIIGSVKFNFATT